MADVRPTCQLCGKPATCFGMYEDELEEQYACDDCCGHGGECGIEGQCESLAKEDDVPCGECGHSEEQHSAKSADGICHECRCPEFVVPS